MSIIGHSIVGTLASASGTEYPVVALFRLDNYLIVVTSWDIYSIDTSDPENPSESDHYDHTGESYQIVCAKMINSTLHVGFRDRLLKFDMSDPSSFSTPTYDHQFLFFGGEFEIDDSYIYFATYYFSGGFWFKIARLSDDNQMFLGFKGSTSYYDFELEGTNLYCLGNDDWSDGAHFSIFDVSDPSSPSRTATHNWQSDVVGNLDRHFRAGDNRSYFFWSRQSAPDAYCIAHTEAPTTITELDSEISDNHFFNCRVFELDGNWLIVGQAGTYVSIYNVEGDVLTLVEEYDTTVAGGGCCIRVDNYLYVFGNGTTDFIRVYGFTRPDRIYVWLGEPGNIEKHELTDPNYPMALSARTERGRDEELGYAAAGIAEVVCDNYFGDFSPENSEGAYYGDLALGKTLYIYEIYNGTKYKHFLGKIDSIEPHPEHDNLIAYILAVDGMDDLAGSEIETVLRTDTDANELVGDILDAANDTESRDLDPGIDTLQLGWFHQIHALSAIRMLEDATRGFFLIDVDGTRIWQNRHYRITGARITSQHDFGESVEVIAYSWNKRDVKNWARVTGYKYIDPYYGLPDEEWIWYAPAGESDAIRVPAGATITIWAPLAGPRKQSDTLVKGEHWNANRAYDKSGTDLSDNITVTPTYYGQSIKFEIANAGDDDAYMVEPDSPPSGAPENATLLVYGTIYEELSMTVIEEDTTSQTDYGKRTISVDAKFKSNYNDVRSYAQWLIQRLKDPIPSPVRVRINAWTDYPDDTIKVQCLTRKISDRITVASTKLGIDQDFYIDKVIQDYVLNEGGMVHYTEYSLSRVTGQAEGLFWLLEKTGFSELEETTRLGF